MSSVEVRLAVMEERLNQYETSLLRYEKQIESLYEQVSRLNQNIESILRIISKYQGMGVAAIVLITGVSSVAAYFINLFFKR
jgi:hypothetical protein